MITIDVETLSSGGERGPGRIFRKFGAPGCAYDLYPDQDHVRTAVGLEPGANDIFSRRAIREGIG